jgi:hypothetical protein
MGLGILLGAVHVEEEMVEADRQMEVHPRGETRCVAESAHDPTLHLRIDFLGRLQAAGVKTWNGLATVQECDASRRSCSQHNSKGQSSFHSSEVSNGPH